LYKDSTYADLYNYIKNQIDAYNNYRIRREFGVGESGRLTIDNILDRNYEYGFVFLMSKSSLNFESAKNILKKVGLFLKKSSVFFIVILQFLIIYLIINPINLYSQLTSVQIINEIAAKSSTPPNELPQIGVIGDKKNLGDIEDLKAGNAVDAQIYKEAKNGDFVIGYTSKLIIYRPETKQIIYEGDTPQQILAKSQQAIINLVQKKALEDKLINDKTPAPQASVVVDPESVKIGNDFYKDVQANDIIANFTNPDLLVIYRPSENKIVKSGVVSLNIK